MVRSFRSLQRRLERTYREVGGKPGELGVIAAKRRMFSKESDLSVNLDAARRSSNQRAEKVQFDSGKESPQLARGEKFLWSKGVSGS